MQRMKKIGVVTNSSPLLTLNAGGGGGCLFPLKKEGLWSEFYHISSWFLHARFFSGLNTELLQNKLNICNPASLRV